VAVGTTENVLAIVQEELQEADDFSGIVEHRSHERFATPIRCPIQR
jgi:hypothetical protein